MNKTGQRAQDSLEAQSEFEAYKGRAFAFARSINPLNLFLTREQILKEKETYEALAKRQGELSAAEFSRMRTAQARVNSAIHPDTGEFIPRPFRFGIFVPVNIPIVLGMLMGSPKFFIHWHVLNQAVNAGINYGNRNASAKLDNTQIALGFTSAVVSATFAVTFLKSRITSMMGGKTGLVTNLLINASAAGLASFVNTNCIRYGETVQGIPVYKDKAMTEQVGVSRKAAWQSIEFTALSRVFQAVLCLVVPTVFSLSLSRFTRGSSRTTKTAVEVGCILASLCLACPASVALFPSQLSAPGEQLEAEFKECDRVHFSKGI